MLMLRRILLVFALTLGLLGVAGRAAAAPETTRPQARPVAEGVWMVQGLSALGSSANRNFISNAGFAVTSDGQALSAGILGAQARVRMEGGRILTGIVTDTRTVRVDL